MRLLQKILAKNLAPRSTRRDNPFFLYDPGEILNVLAEIGGAVNVISLYFPDQPGRGFASSISRVGSDALLFDQVSCMDGHARLLEKRTFRALAKFQGVPVTFDCKLIGLVQRNGKVCYKASFPERLYYPQKRHFLRIHVACLQRPVRIVTKPGKNLINGMEEGVIEDIGVDGISFVIKPVMHIRRLDVLRGCSFVTTLGQTVEFCLEVRHVRPLRGRTKIRVGGRFLNLTGDHNCLLQKELLVLKRMIYGVEEKTV